MKTRDPALTVVLATYNGGARLRQTLESMTALRPPEGGWQLIVVDNASSDDSASIIASFAARLPLLALHCPVRGKNAALNCAIPYFRGALIVFTDDDVILPADWLLLYEELARREPDYAVFGGRVSALWPQPPSREILEGVSLGNAFAIHEDGIPDGPIAPGKIWGPNMAVRASIFASGHRYDESIGPAGGNYVPGSESSFNLSLAREGVRFYFTNQIVVLHQIRPEQLTQKWLKLRAYRLGKGQVRWAQYAGRGEAVPKLWIFPRWYVRHLLHALRQYLVSRLLRQRTQRMRAAWNLMVGWGMVVETVRLHRESAFREQDPYRR